MGLRREGKWNWRARVQDEKEKQLLLAWLSDAGLKSCVGRATNKYVQIIQYAK